MKEENNSPAAVHGPRVTAADRTAAEMVLDTLLLATEPSMLSPDDADDIIGQAFARHREASQAELLEALERQTDNMAFVLNHFSVPAQWFDLLTNALAEDRAALTKARTDATGEAA